MPEFILMIWAILSMAYLDNILLWLIGMAIACLWYVLAHNTAVSMGWRSKDGRW